MMKLKHLAYLALLSAAAACQDPSFSINGVVEDAEGKTLLLEKADNAGIWIPLDSTKLNSRGKFSFSGHAPAAPEIYRVALDGHYIYFPIDSIEHLTLNTSAARFANGFSLEGSENAVNLATFEKQLLAASANLANPDSAKAFKRRVYSQFLQNARGSVVSYYILTKTVDGRPLFDAVDDASYFGAVATSFRQFRPEDPRCRLLEEIATQGLRRKAEAAGKQRVVHAEEISFFPISLPDEEGRQVALSDIAGKGTPTVLLFADHSDPATAEITSRLSELAALNKIKVYDVGVDGDALVWRNAARNLPFTTVYANVSDASGICSAYQVNSVPTIFIIDAGGTLTSRHADIDSALKAI